VARQQIKILEDKNRFAGCEYGEPISIQARNIAPSST